MFTERRLELCDPFIDLLYQKTKSLGTLGLVCDLDDFLLDTTPYILRYQGKFIEKITQKTYISYERAWGTMEKYSDLAFDSHYVSRDRWYFVAERMGRELCGTPTIFNSALEELFTLYEGTPKFLPGAVTFLRSMKAINHKIAIVTHRNFNWAMVSFEKLGLGEFIDSFVVAAENEPKSDKHWVVGMKQLDLPPLQLIGGGDSVHGDLIPLVNLGTKVVIGVPPHPSHKRAHNGNPPPQAIMKKSILYAHEAILEASEANG